MSTSTPSSSHEALQSRQSTVDSVTDAITSAYGDVGLAYTEEPAEDYGQPTQHNDARRGSSHSHHIQDQGQSSPVDDAPPPPPYQLTAAIEDISALRIDDSPRQNSSTQSPVSPSQPRMRPSDVTSVHSSRSTHSSYASAHDSWGYDQSVAETDRTSAYSQDERFGHYPPNIPNGPNGGPYPPGPHAGPQPGYGPPVGYQNQRPYGYPPTSVQPLPPVREYNPLYLAASDVLGMGPPPGAAIPNGVQRAPSHSLQYSPMASHPQQFLPPARPSSAMSQSPYHQPSQYMPPGSVPPGMAPMHPGSSSSSLMRAPTNASSISEEREIDSRPPLNRQGTTDLVSLRTHKTKAIDLSAPPFTKEYIDQYRQRIKDDPDPEAHFLYAKYLIDAAKKIGSDAKDQRAVKKLRDSLISESLKVIRRLATQGDAYDEAQFFLANCHGTGMLGLQVDHERAYHLYLQAAKQNHPAASYRVAVCNEIGAGTRREPQRAAAFYRKAASLGDTAAMYKLGVILLRGSLGEQPNPREAVGWLKRAAEQADEENPHALHELAMLYENPQSQVVPFDPAYAKDLYTRAGHLGYTHSQYKLGQCYEYGALTCPVDPRRSIAWYTKAAEKGHSEAELALSGWYLTGSEGVLKQSDSEAYLWARRAANKALSKAEYAVGYYAEVGIGVKQDIEFAKRWYMRAAAQGNKRAMNRLTEMKRSGNKRTNTARPTRQDAKDECVIM
ncbi:unnamed protein product [Somion occarium]|uniref:HCP-like protein n=2 Tax=Somion occarium TaxID=3059160 RepID=A0ABP1D7M9_9APHY